MESFRAVVVITTYKRPLNILARAIESALAQTFNNYEIVVVNDYPEDIELSKSIQKYILELKCANIRYISYDHNKGACAARNFGVQNSESEYISFLDDDDEWLPSKLEMQINAFTDTSVGLSYSPYYEYDEKNLGKISNNTPLTDNPVKQLLESNFIGGCSMVTVRRAAFEQVGGFDEKLLASQDYDLWMRIIQNYKAKYVNVPLIKRYLGEDSISVNFDKKRQGWDSFIDKNNDLYVKWQDSYNYKLNSIASQCIWFGENSYALKYWKRAIGVAPFCIKNNCMPLRSIISKSILKRK